jgi:hypothetical protein
MVLPILKRIEIVNMKSFALRCALLTLLGLAPGLLAPVYAQTPTPAPPAAGQNSHAQLEASLQQLNLRPRQKIEILKVVKAAKDSGQDKAVTLEQVMGILEPAQKEQLLGIMKANAAAK